MFRFFHRIRQNLFLEGRVSRYLGYAVGEIVLIVAGILIALEANEWKEERRDRNEGRYILRRLSVEITSSLDFIGELSEVLAKKQVALQRLKSAFQGDPVHDSSEFLNNIAFGAYFAWSQPVLPRSTYTELVNSGKFGLIRNAELRGLIHNYYDNDAEGQKLTILETTQRLSNPWIN